MHFNHVTGVLSFTNSFDSNIPQINCTLATFVQQRTEFPNSLFLLLTGFFLILVDILITLLLCVVKCLKCGVLVITWYLVISVCTLVWTVLSIIYLAVVVPVWANDKGTCDYLVMIMTLVTVGYCGVLAIIYLAVIVVVIAYDCNRYRNLKDF